MPNGQQRRRQGQRGAGTHQDSTPIDLSKVVLKPSDKQPLDPELFSEIAEQVAKKLGEERNAPKPSQIRKFFDELVMWEERVQQDQSKFSEYLPFIRMLNAKAAYAKGRNHVTEDFLKLMAHCLQQVNDAVSLHNFKLFFEAFIGFYKLHGPKG